MSENFTKKFEENHPILAAALNTVHDMVLILDKDRKIVYINKSFEDFAQSNSLTAKVGIRPGNAFNCVHAVAGDDLCGTTDFCRFCGGNKAITDSLRGETTFSTCKIVSLNSASYDLEVSASPLNIDETSMTLYCLKDTSAVSRKKMLEKIFFHDVNNIVGGISLIAELLADNCDSRDEENISNMNLLVAAIESLKKEIQSQHMITMAEKDELMVRPIDTCLLEIIDHTIDFFNKSTISNGIEIIKEIHSHDTCIISDPIILKRIVTNMVKNACEASLQGQKVTVGYEHGKDSVSIVVHNETVMPDSVSKSIFKKSFSTKGEGRGFGTYSMRLLTERYLKGSIYFTSIDGEGTKFYLELPLKLQN